MFHVMEVIPLGGGAHIYYCRAVANVAEANPGAEAAAFQQAVAAQHPGAQLIYLGTLDQQGTIHAAHGDWPPEIWAKLKVCGIGKIRSMPDEPNLAADFYVFCARGGLNYAILHRIVPERPKCLALCASLYWPIQS